MKKVILTNFILLNFLIAGIMSMPMGIMSKGAQMGASMPIAKDMVDESKMFAVSIYTERNYALRDKTYLYSSVQNENKEESYLSKILLERSFQLDKDSFARIGGIASYDNKEAKGRIHTLYYDVDFFVNAVNIKIGREIKSFGYDSHFNVIDFLSKNDSLYNTKDIFIKRNSVDAISVRMNNTSGNNYMSIYSYENDIADDIDDVNYLLEISTLRKSSKSSMFINKSDDNTSIAVATRRNIGKDTSIKASIRYDKYADKRKSISSSSSFLYDITNSFLIGADYGAWKKDIKADNKSIIFHHTIYTKFKLGKLRIKAGYLKDEKEKTNISLGYHIDNVKIYMDGFIDAKNKDENLIRFMISYLN